MLTSGFLIPLAVFTGALVPLQLALNSQLGGVTKSPFTAAIIVFSIALVTLAIILAAFRPPMPERAALAEAPLSVWFGGFVVAAYMVLSVIVTPRLGVGFTTVLILAGQILMALLLDHFGLFGNAQQSISLTKILGGALIVGGVVLVKYG